jgi:hypothetical protein
VTNLKRLSLAGTGMTDSSIEQLARLSLHLKGAKVTAAAVAVMQRELPDCTVLGP